jgi:metal-sulfur cluster biosynthetic enzyme
MTPTADRVLVALEPVIDPELGASIVDLGLVYGVDVAEDGRVVVRFTSTVPDGPLAPVLAHAIVQAVSRLGGVTSVEPVYVAEPAWDPSRMRPEMFERFGNDRT